MALNVGNGFLIVLYIGRDRFYLRLRSNHKNFDVSGENGKKKKKNGMPTVIMRRLQLCHRECFGKGEKASQWHYFSKRIPVTCVHCRR